MAGKFYLVKKEVRGMAVTYNAGTNEITIDGMGTPVSYYNLMENLYIEDQAGGWGVITKHNDYQYTLGAKLLITNDSYVQEAYKQIYIPQIFVAEYEKVIDIVKGTLRFGWTNNVVTKDIRGGCDIHMQNAIGKVYILYGENKNDAVLNLYGCRLFNRGSMFGVVQFENGRVWSNIWENVYAIGRDADLVDIYDLTFQGGTYRGFSNFYPGTMNQIRILNMHFWAVSLDESADGKSVNDLYVRGCQALVNVQENFVSPMTFTLRDINTDSWKVNWRELASGRVYRSYSFETSVIDENSLPMDGVSVNIKDQHGSDIYIGSTDSTGGIGIELVRSYCENPDDNLDTNTTYDGSPFRIILTKAGYENEDFTFELNDKMTCGPPIQMSPV